LYRFPSIVQGLGQFGDNERGHGGVDLACQLDESRDHAMLSRDPREGKRIKGNAMTSQARPGGEGLETERVGLCSLDHLPNVDAHPVVEHLEFVYQSYVYSTISILEYLARLGHLRTRDGDRANHNALI